MYEADWGLRIRMGVVLLALGALYAGFVAVLAVIFDSVALVVAGAAVVVGLQYYFSDRLALSVSGARRVGPDEYPDLQARVERLAHGAGIPAPDVAVIDSAVPNAFATGRSRESAVVCVTTGLLLRLDGDELDAVLAHELAHVKNRDVAVLTVASSLSLVAYGIVRHAWLFGDGDGGGDGGGEMVWLLGVFVASLVAWVGSYLLIRAVSRYREYAADRGAAAITGNPAALASALVTIECVDVADEDLRENAAMNAFFIVPESTPEFVGDLMRTHPPTDRRIDRLREMERSAEG